MPRIPTGFRQAAKLNLYYGPSQHLKPPCVFGLRIEGGLDVSLLETSLTWLVRRHTALRTYFPAETSPDLGLCLNSREAVWRLNEYDLRATPDALLAAKEQEILTNLQQPLAPDHYPMFRGYLLRYNDHWLLGIAVSHIIFDGESIEVFLSDLQYIYRHLYMERSPAGLTAVQSDFGKFALWEKQWLQSSEANQSVRYWADAWAKIGPYPMFHVPVNSGSLADDNGGLWYQTLPVESIDRRRSDFQDGHISLFALAAGSVLKALSGLTNQTDFGLIYTTSRRQLAMADKMIGFLNSRSLLHVHVPQDAKSDEFHNLARSAILESMEHNMLPFEYLLEKLAPQYTDSQSSDLYIDLNVDSAPPAPYLHDTKTEITWPVAPGTFDTAPYVSIDISNDSERRQVTVSCGYPTGLPYSEFINELMSNTVESLISSH